MENINDINRSSIEELLRRFLSIKTEEFRNNNYTGVIIDNNDPAKLGRCKVRVRPMMETILDQDLPWALPNPTFIGSLEGNFIVPPNGALVNINFRNNDLNFPEYTTMVVDSNNLPNERLEDYPDTMVMLKTDDGTYATYNRKTGEFVFRHSSGAMFTFDKNGTLIFDSRYTALGTMNITCLGKVTLNAPIIEFPQGNVLPSGSGPFNCLHVDPLTGLVHSGNMEIRVGI